MELPRDPSACVQGVCSSDTSSRTRKHRGLSPKKKRCAARPRVQLLWQSCEEQRTRSRPGTSPLQLRCGSARRPDSSTQWTHTLGSVSQSFQRNRNPGKGKPISTVCVAALGNSLFHLSHEYWIGNRRAWREPCSIKIPSTVDGRQREIVVCDIHKSFEIVVAMPLTNCAARRQNVSGSICLNHYKEVNEFACAFPFPISVKIRVTLHVVCMPA